MTGPHTYDDLESTAMLETARLRVEEQCDLFRYEATEEELADAARLLRAWWQHAKDYDVDVTRPAAVAGLAWVAVACIRSRTGA